MRLYRGSVSTNYIVKGNPRVSHTEKKVSSIVTKLEEATAELDLYSSSGIRNYVAERYVRAVSMHI